MPHFAFLHERFLFRFGHDRTMMLHGRELARLGHRVSFVGYRMDLDAIGRLGGSAILLPAGACPWEALDAFTASYLDERWPELFGAGVPDVAVNGGWPFYAAQGVLGRRGVGSVYFDAGAAPMEGLAEAELPVHRLLRTLRRRHVGESQATVSVSTFIARTQTLQDAPATPNIVVLNAVDHLDDPLWTKADAPAGADVARTLTQARAGGRRVVLHLGRWEGGYKNKAGALQVLRGLGLRGVEAALIVLAEGDSELPADLTERVVFAGHPGDAGLRRLMQESDAGLSASLWEGFNLPLAEMHRLGRPAFALDIGAHREAAVDEAYLAADIAQLADRLAERLRAPDRPLAPPARVAAFHAATQWSRAGAELDAVLMEVLQRRRRSLPAQVLVMDVTNACRDPANSGVVRVTRRLGRALQALYRIQFVVFDEDALDYRLPSAEEARRLESYEGPRLDPHWETSQATPVSLAQALARRGWSLDHAVFLLAETVLQPRVTAMAAWLARERVDLVAVLHDLIPLSHPEFADPGIVRAFPAYVELLKGARVLLANSQSTADAWRAHVGETTAVAVELLPGDFGARGTPKRLGHGKRAAVDLLTVSTFEPRKNHLGLLEAFELAQRRAPDLAMTLHLVGNGYEGGDGVLARVRTRAAANPSIHVLGLVDDATLHSLYGQADFTVYPSLVEGFGLPIVESAWRARPFVCHREGAMAEVAAGGGGLTCDVADPSSLADAILRLAGDADLRLRLSLAAGLRPARTWRDYARACLDHTVTGRDVRQIGDVGRHDAGREAAQAA